MTRAEPIGIVNKLKYPPPIQMNQLLWEIPIELLLFAPDLLARGLVAAVPGRRLALARAVVRAFAPRAALHVASFAA